MTSFGKHLCLGTFLMFYVKTIHRKLCKVGIFAKGLESF
jgi:hypothetical protein